MAEAVVIPLIEKIASVMAAQAVNNITSSLVIPLVEIHAGIERVKRELTIMQAFLSHAATTANSDQLVGAWTNQVREAAHSAEDIIDEYSHLMAARCFRRRHSLSKTLHDLINIKAWHRIANQLSKLEAHLHSLSEAKDRYGIKAVADGEGTAKGVNWRRQTHAESTHFMEDDEIVGFDQERNLVMGLLTDETKQLKVISLWGLGGSGKTTLAAHLYRSERTRNHFECLAWVTVSLTSKADDVLRSLLKEVCRGNELMNLEAMSYRRLAEELRMLLKPTRYLIVLDDLWSLDIWTAIRGVLADNNCRSRIIVTTRPHHIAMQVSNSYVLTLQLLQESEALSLLCKKAFGRNANRDCPKELEYWARKFVEKCQGLPLAIVSIGSLLALREQSESEWRNVYSDFNWVLTNSQELNRVHRILNHSFNDLPYYLRNCFLYCSIFPEDHLIKRKKLIRLWVAEGFINERGTKTMEEVAEDCLDELVRRSMFQVVERNDFGRVKAFRVHDLMRELLIWKSSKENFCTVCDSSEGVRLDHRVRRLSLHSSNINFQPSAGTMKHLRSFFAFDTVTPFSSLLSSAIFGLGFRLLTVLDLEGVPIKTLPEEVVHLFNLHYMGLRYTQLRMLPKSLERLQNLQTLDIWGTKVMKLPHSITELKNLRHLFVHTIHDPTDTQFAAFSGVQPPKGIWNLKNLQTLQSIEADETVEKLGNLKQLRSFRITKVRRGHCEPLWAAIAKMRHLQHLDVVARDEGEAFQLESLLETPPLLQKLWLRGKVEKGLMASQWFGTLRNLEYLGLHWSQLGEDLFPSLGSLPNLVLLELRKAYDGQKICFQKGWFPKLKSLSLFDLTKLNWIEIEEGALVNLGVIHLRNCENIKKIPAGIENLKFLQRLELEEMPQELVEKVRQGGPSEEESIKVKNIPSITNMFKRDGRWFRQILT